MRAQRAVAAPQEAAEVPETEQTGV